MRDSHRGITPGERAVKVVIAEDHYLVREGTRRVLESSGEVDVVAAVENTDALLDAVGRLRPDAVITDIRMPPTHQLEGIVAAHRIRSGHPGVGVVVLSQYVNSLYAFELFHDGTAGLAYLLKDRVGDLEELIRALREVTSGGSVIDPSVVEGLLGRRQQPARSLLESLTTREMDVLHEMAQGKSNAAISGALFISPSAVEKHINAIFGKLLLSPEDGAQHRRVAAVLTFLRNQDLGGPTGITPGSSSQRSRGPDDPASAPPGR
jgi:DNA-binding NarL/FixJ family response regulator